jgi:hypothetical protein
MGIPLNMRVEHRYFDRTVSKHWFKIVKAENDLDHALADYIERSSAGTPGKFNKIKRRNEVLSKVAADAQKFAEHYDNDPMQQEIISGLIQRAVAVVEWWRDAFATCEAGEEFKFTLGDVPRVFPLH